MKKIVLFFYFIICLNLFAYAGYVKYYTINEGLSNNAIYSLTQDSKGLMWFGSIDGLHSFDGNRIKVWRDKMVQTLGPAVSAIQEDDNRNLWVGTDQGLAIFDLCKEQFWSNEQLKEKELTIRASIKKICLDSDKNMWIATFGQGIFYYNTKTNQMRHYQGQVLITSEYFWDIMEDHNGTIWAVSDKDGIARYNSAKDRFEKCVFGKYQKNVSMFEDSRNNLWVGSAEYGLLLLDTKTMQMHQKVAPLDNKRPLHIRRIVEWSPGVIYFASDEGLISYNIETEECKCWGRDTPEIRLNDNYLQSLFVDIEGALWVGSYFGGVNYVSPFNMNFKHYDQDNSDFDARIIGVFAHAHDDNLWIGTDDAGFFFWNRKQNTFTPYRPNHHSGSPTYHNIHSMLQVGDSLYVGMYLGGLDVLDLKNNKIQNHKANESEHSLYSSNIYALYNDTKGNIWVGTTNGLNRYDQQRNDFDRIFQTHGANISNIMEDAEGSLWICSRNKGIFCLSSKTDKWRRYYWKPEEKQNLILSNNIETMAEDKYGTIWIGTNGDGLHKFIPKENRFIKVPLTDDAHVIQKVIAYGDALWLSTSNGVYEYSIKSETLRTYNKFDGLQDNYFLPNSGIQLSDGTILFGGINGFNEFHPNRIVTNKNRPNVILTDFKLFNESIDVGVPDSPLKKSLAYADKLELSYQQSIFGFSVAALSYTNTSKILYRYKMEGLDRDWIMTRKNPCVTYTQIPSGNYRFLVSVSNGSGNWYENVIDFPISILPPWWTSQLAIFIYVVLALGILSYIFYCVNRRHRLKLKNLTREKDQEIYNSKMEFFTVMIHEIRTPLTLILSPLENLMKSKLTVEQELPKLQIIERNGKRLLSLVNQLMDYRKIEEGGMAVELKERNVKDVLNDVLQHFGLLAQLKGIQLLSTMPKDPCLALIDEEAFIKVISNLLSNALKFTETHIWVELSKTSRQELCISIRDNGIGISTADQQKIFQPFFQVKPKKELDNIGTGVGLHLVKKMIDLMDGSLKLESEIGVGTKFSIILKEICKSDSIQSTEESQGEPITKAQKVEIETVSTGQPILVVDDNLDMVKYLTGLLNSEYQVFSASNGEEALAVLAERQIELLITDVMMPIMDGVELCKRIKTNLQFSHIPVIILTAKVRKKDKLEGWENGADLYIEKPFSSDILLAQIAGLLRNVDRIKGGFKTATPLSSITDSLSKLDSEFFQKVTNFIMEHMAESDLDVHALAKGVGVSRSGLFAKMKAVSGMSPNDYIRLTRLKRASELLLTGEDVQISEIGFEVGFSSPSYFTKCFQNQFGVSPTEFRRKNMNIE